MQPAVGPPAVRGRGAAWRAAGPAGLPRAGPGARRAGPTGGSARWAGPFVRSAGRPLGRREASVLEFRLFRAIWFTFYLTDGRSVSHTHSLANRDADVNRNP